MKLRVSLALVAAVCVVAFGTRVFVSAEQTPRNAAPAVAVPTFTKDVAPILFQNCTSCHRPGEIAPMSLLTYEDARPYARAIMEEVEAGHMPPWHAEAPEGTFVNERRLSAADKATLLKWANGGAPKGNDADMPKAPVYSDGWAIGTPDKIFEMVEPFKVPASGTIEYQYVYIPTDIKEPTWIKAIEVRPGARGAVHHVLVFYKARPDMTRTPVLTFNPEQMRMPPRDSAPATRRNDGVPSRIIGTYAPGTNPQVLPPGTAIRLEAGGVLELQIHYTATGEPVTDRTKVGFVLSKEPSPREVRVSQYFNAQFTLPAGAANAKVDADVTFAQATTLWGIFPHTHLRGKKWQYTLELPDGTKKVVLDVPRYDFNWQTYYMFKEPLLVPAGAKLHSSAWYDNSAKNPDNPDPKVDVHWGDQTWEEMQYTGLLFSPLVAPKDPSPGRK